MPSAGSFRPNRPGSISEVLDGEASIVNLESGAYYSLTGAGADIWTAAESSATLAEIIHRVGAQFTGMPTEISAGVTALVEELVSEGVLVADSAASAALPDPGPGDGPASMTRPPFVRSSLQKYTDMADLLLLDPIHEVDEQGWPHTAPDA